MRTPLTLLTALLLACGGRLLMKSDAPPVTHVSSWSINGQISNSQSLGVGYGASPGPISTTQPYSNCQLFDSTGAYNLSSPFASTLSLLPLIAPERLPLTASGTYQYPGNIFGESPDVSEANGHTFLALQAGYSRYVICSSNTGAGAVSLSFLNKGGTYNAYAAGIYEATAINNLTRVAISAATGSSVVNVTAASHNLQTGNKVYLVGATGMTELNGYWPVTVTSPNTFVVNGLTATHVYAGGASLTSYGVENVPLTLGESDAFFNTGVTYYINGVTKLLADYQSDISAVTGQTESIYLVQQQQNSSDLLGYGVPQSNDTAQALYQMAVASTPNVFESGPEYQRPQSSGPHLTAAGYVGMGEKYAQVAQSVRTTGSWSPLYATHGTMKGSTNVVVTFHVPVGHLVFDEKLPPPHQSGLLSIWSNGNGFEATDVTTIGFSAMTGAGVSPIEITTNKSVAPFGLVTGSVIGITGNVAGNAAANGVFSIHVLDSMHITLDGTTGSGAWMPGAGGVTVLLPITSATITGGDQVTLVLGSPATTRLVIGYADTPDVRGQNVGCPGYRCGLLRDQDPYRGLSGAQNYNFLLEFYAAPPF